MSDKVVSYEEFVKGLVPEQFKEATLLNGMLRVIYLQAQELESMLYELYRRYNVDVAEGVALDDIGVIIGTYRLVGESDDSYRQRLRGGAFYSGVPGTEAVRELLKNILGTENVGIYPDHPAGYYVVTDAPIESVVIPVSDLCASGVSARVGTYLIQESDYYGYIVSEDTGAPFIIEYGLGTMSEYELVTDQGDNIVDSEGNTIAVFDF